MGRGRLAVVAAGPHLGHRQQTLKDNQDGNQDVGEAAHRDPAGCSPVPTARCWAAPHEPPFKSTTNIEETSCAS